MGHRTSVAYVAALAAIVAVAESATAFECPARGGRPWRELTSDHFVVATDMTTSEASDLLRELELMRAAVLAALFRNPPTFPGHLTVVAFRSAGDFHEFAPDNWGAYFAHLGDVERAIVTPGVQAYKGRDVLAHELTHYFTAFVLLRQPAWLREGLACYLEPLGTVALGASMRVGTVPEHRKVRTRRDRVPLRDLLAWDGRPVEFHLERYYDSSWLLVHYLVNKRPKEFGDLQQRLARAESPQDAWRATFPEYDPDVKGTLDGLEEALDVHVRGGYRYRELDLQVSPQFAERAMSSAEVHAVRLRLWAQRQGGGRDEAALKAEVAEALAEDPGDPIALQARVTLEKGDVVAAARQAVAVHPESWRAWRFLGGALAKDPKEREAALRKAAELAPDEPATLNGLAWMLVGDGRSGEALPVARKAARLAPHSASVLDTYAAVLADLGQCPDALLAQHRALDLLPEGASQPLYDQFRERLVKVERQCGSAPAGPAR